MIMVAVGLWASATLAIIAYVVVCWRIECRDDRRMIDEMLRRRGMVRLRGESDIDALARIERNTASVDYQRWVEDSGIVDVSDPSECTTLTDRRQHGER